MSDEVYVSRRSSSVMMLSGCGSKARTYTYRFDASYAILASVLKPARGSFPSVGRHILKFDATGASRHTASSSRPSITGATAARVAATPVSVTAFGGAAVLSIGVDGTGAGLESCKA